MRYFWRDAEVTSFQGNNLKARCQLNRSQDELAATKQQLQDDFAFIATSNVGGEFVIDDKVRTYSIYR
ncbi:hypothetical protein O9992_00165 [Vibrio lentus]|nr:hypothetical protein [Vibrio lentus]